MKAAVVVRFQRTQGAKWETGVTVVQQTGVSDIGNVIDSDGNIVQTVHDYALCYIFGTMSLPSADYFKR